MELVKAYLQKQEQQQAQLTLVTQQEEDERPVIDLGELVQFLKLDIDFMIRRTS